MALNKVMLIGNLGKDPEVKNIQGGAKVASFSVAVTEKYRDKDGNVRENTEWVNVVVWDKKADVAERYMSKGTQVYVEGKLRTRSWDDQSGAKHSVTEVVADSIQLLGSKPALQGAPQQRQQTAPQYSRPVQQRMQMPSASQEDLPF